MIIPNASAVFCVLQSAGHIDAKGNPVPDAYTQLDPVDCNLVIKSKTNTAGEPAESFTRSAYEFYTETLPEGATFVTLLDSKGNLIDNCEIQYTERLEYVDAFKTIAYAKQR